MTTESETPPETLKATPLDALHRALGAKMVPFAGYAMPLHYKAGILTEHLHTRRAAGLFDVSHMGQLRLIGAGADRAIERLVPGDVEALAPGQVRYTMLTSADGGILDDLMITRREGELGVIVNAATKEDDIAHIGANLPVEIALVHEAERALLALQGPLAAAILARHVPGIDTLGFMAEASATLAGAQITLTRSGYTGEDGFELSVPAASAEAVAQKLLDEEGVQPIGLGARDSLRLEAGLCLYGHDIDETTTPIEADLAWTISKRRRAEGGFLGDRVILRQLRDGAERRRVGLLPEGRAPAREGAEILDRDGRTIGRVTSGGFGPSADRPVAMGYVERAAAAPGTAVGLVVRGRTLPGTVAAMPFVPHGYHRTR